MLLAGCGSDGAKGAKTDATADPAPTITSTTAAQGLPPGAELLPVLDLDKGNCFDAMPGSAAADQAVWHINCNDAHAYEVYEVVTYDADGSRRGSPYPGADAVRDWSEQACYAQFEAFVGVRWTISDLDIKVWWPSQKSWDNNDRGIICTVMAANGSKLTGTQRGTRH